MMVQWWYDNTKKCGKITAFKYVFDASAVSNMSKIHKIKFQCVTDFSIFKAKIMFKY